MALALCAALAAPFAVFAADTAPLQEGWQLYPEACKCVGSAPDFACVGEVVRNLVNLAIAVGVVIFVLVAAYAGVMFMTTATNPRGKEQAKSMLTSALIGFVTMLAAWLLIDFIMGALYNKAWGPWNSILSNPQAEHCLKQNTTPAPSIDSGVTGEAGDPVDASTVRVGDSVECALGDSEPGEAYRGTVTSAPAGDPPTMGVSLTSGRTSASEPWTAINPARSAEARVSSCRTVSNNGTTDTGDTSDLSGINVTVRPPAVVSDTAVTKLKRILRAANLTSATITSGRRTAADQARIMEENLHNGVRINYAAAGDAVTAVYDRLRAEGKSRAEIRAAMEAEINRQGCSNVSKHCTTQDVIDVSPGSISNRSAFESAVRAFGVSAFYRPGEIGEQTYHIEF